MQEPENDLTKTIQPKYSYSVVNDLSATIHGGESSYLKLKGAIVWVVLV